MCMTEPFPELLCVTKSVAYEIFTVDKMWIKQHARGMFQFIRLKIAPVSVATHRCSASGAAITARCATAR